MLHQPLELSGGNEISDEEEDMDMIGARYITEEAAEVMEAQIRLEIAVARGLRLGEEIVDWFWSSI